jgi:UDP-N-acetylglucosamine 2-epimerase (non-hydrolysing)
MDALKKVLFVVGTRPEAIKLAPIIKEFQKDKNNTTIQVRICSTGQHKEMLHQVFEFFSLALDYDLEVMKPNQNLFSLTSDILLGLQNIFEHHYRPDLVFVHGDTTTTLAASLAAFYSGIQIGHIEAGLRTYDKKSPFPEEINRQLVSRIADLNFAPTEAARDALLSEGVAPSSIYVTGNSVIDALLEAVELVKYSKSSSLQMIKKMVASIEPPIILVTGHRRENHGQGFLNICKALKTIAEDEDCHIVYPVHLNPNVKDPVHKLLSGIDNIHLIDPQPYEAFVYLMSASKLILTDSGGIQEEAPSLGKPVLVMRNTTERPEAVEQGTVILVGTDVNKITGAVSRLLRDEEQYKAMSRLHNPYGDGHTAKAIFSIVTKWKK